MLKDPGLAGLILGSPCYFRSLSSLCKAFIERCMPLRDPPAPLADKWVGALAVAGNRHGGQELVVQQILHGDAQLRHDSRGRRRAGDAGGHGLELARRRCDSG